MWDNCLHGSRGSIRTGLRLKVRHMVSGCPRLRVMLPEEGFQKDGQKNQQYQVSQVT